MPRNLCFHLPEGVDLCDVAFMTVGAISLQGVRPAEFDIRDLGRPVRHSEKQIARLTQVVKRQR